jgi:hypothetical protein
MANLTISPLIRRRFILGKQGLWPGRRWEGKAGAAQAIREMGMVQVDPLVVIARNHDLKLYSRVQSYMPAHLNELLYTDRQFFDYGNWLMIYPMEELPYWRLHMKRNSSEPRWRTFAEQNLPLLEEVRAELRARGALGHRDIEGHARVESYRARKDTGLALYYLWIAGELMTHGRRNFDRLYDFTEKIVPAIPTISDDEAEHYFLRKTIQTAGMTTLSYWRSITNYFIRRTMSAAAAKTRLTELVSEGTVTPVQIEGERDLHYLFTADMPLLEALQAGEIPAAWKPLDTDTMQEVNFLAPLDPVSARGRATKLFDFEYKWEVYTPAEKRRWGYYVLPILYKDALVGRLDPKLDRPTKTMLIKNFLLENPELATETEFAHALAAGLARFTRFHEVEQIDLAPLAAFKPLHKRVVPLLKKAGIVLK